VSGPPAIYAGRTLFLTAGGHLWVVVTEPVGDPTQVVIVNLTTARGGSDSTVILEPGEHPFVSRPTSVRYSDARLANVTTLQALAGGPGDTHQDFATEVLGRIRQGLLDSPFTPEWLKGFCRGQWESAQ